MIISRTNILEIILPAVLILFLALCFFPVASHAQISGLTYECTGGQPGDCTFNDLILEVRNVTNTLTIIAIEFCVVVIAYAGFKYMMSDGNPSKRSEANRIFFSVLKGMLFILCAWLIVTLITRTLIPNINTFLG